MTMHLVKNYSEMGLMVNNDQVIGASVWFAHKEAPKPIWTNVSLVGLPLDDPWWSIPHWPTVQSHTNIWIINWDLTWWSLHCCTDQPIMMGQSTRYSESHPPLSLTPICRILHVYTLEITRWVKSLNAMCNVHKWFSVRFPDTMDEWVFAIW